MTGDTTKYSLQHAFPAESVPCFFASESTPLLPSGLSRPRRAGLSGAVLLLFALLLVSCGGNGSRKVPAASMDKAAGTEASALPASAVPSPKLNVAQPPVMLTDDSLRREWLAGHYWDNFDYGDAAWIADTSALEGTFTPWAQMLAMLPEAEAAELAGELLRKGNDHPEMQLRLLEVAEYFWHHPNSPFRSEELMIPVLEAVAAAPGIDTLYKMRPKALLASAMKNRPGTRAADITYTMGSGTIGRLRDIRAEYLLLMFYNPGCPECTRIEEYIPQSEVFAPLIASGRLKVLAVYPDDDVMAWRSHLPQMPAGWTVGHAPMDKGGTAAYDLPGIPALYLLDRNKRVLVKDCPEDIIEAWLAQHADGK